MTFLVTTNYCIFRKQHFKKSRYYFFVVKIELLFSFDGQTTNSKTKNVTENYNAINWTPMKSEELLDFYDEAPLEMQCQSGAGNKELLDKCERAIKLHPFIPKC